MGCIGKLLLTAVGLVVILFVLGLFLDPQRGGGGGYNAPIETRDLRSSERSTIADAVRGALKDPASARFRIGRVAYMEDKAERNTRMHCGWVNAKNSFGGYSGEQMFMVLLNVQDERVMGAALAGLDKTNDGSSVEELCAIMGYGDYYLSTTTFKDAH